MPRLPEALEAKLAFLLTPLDETGQFLALGSLVDLGDSPAGVFPFPSICISGHAGSTKAVHADIVGHGNHCGLHFVRLLGKARHTLEDRLCMGEDLGIERLDALVKAVLCAGRNIAGIAETLCPYPDRILVRLRDIAFAVGDFIHDEWCRAAKKR